MSYLLKRLLALLVVGISLLLYLPMITDNKLYKIPPPSTCNVDPFVSFNPQGRLGNQICEYIHLFHAHKTYFIEVSHTLQDAILRERQCVKYNPHEQFNYIQLPRGNRQYFAISNLYFVDQLFPRQISLSTIIGVRDQNNISKYTQQK